MTGSAHDALAFEHTCAVKYPDWFFDDNEFAWADSAYPVTHRTIPVFRQPASFVRRNEIFNKVVSHLRVRSEHCMGALKGRWQCLRGLRVMIKSNKDHIRACRWVTIAIILHNAVVDIEGEKHASHFIGVHTRRDEEQDRGSTHEPLSLNDNEAKRELLIDELLAARDAMYI